jgi:hypothetical protein
MHAEEAELTAAELAEGWHWCWEFDGLLVGPEMGELNHCHCLPEDHPVYQTRPLMESGAGDDSLPF